MATSKDPATAVLASIPIESGEVYVHYKGGEYKIITLAIKEDTLEPLVIYSSLKKASTWARTLDDWREMVAVDGVMVPRFRKKTLCLLNICNVN